MTARILSSILVFLVTGIVCTAGLPDKDFYFNHIKSEQGLSYGVINDLLLDKRNFVWTATYNGLNCINGKHIKSWKADPSDEKALGNNVIHAICSDSSGNIWCATGAGVSKFNLDHFENFTLFSNAAGKVQPMVSLGILSTRSGKIVAAGQGGVEIYDAGKNQFINYPAKDSSGKLLFNEIYKNAFIEDIINNGIWMGTDNGLMFYDLEKNNFHHKNYNPKKFPLFDHHYVVAITKDKFQRLIYYDGNTHELVTYDFRTANVKKQSTSSWGKGNSVVTTIFTDNKNNKWYSTWSQQLFFEDSETGQIYEFRHQPGNAYSVAADFFWDALQDSSGTIYLGTVNGISYTNTGENFFSIHKLPDGIIHKTEYFGSLVLNADFQENIWVAPAFEYAMRFHLPTGTWKKFDFVPKNKRIPGSQFVSAMEPAKDKLWFGTIDGIYVFDVKSEQFNKVTAIPESENISGHLIKITMLSRNGELWFANHRNGLFMYNIHSGKWKHFKPGEGRFSVSPKLILDIHEDRDGEVLISVAEEGIFRYNKLHETFEKLSVDLPERIFTSIQHDSKNNLWVMGQMSGLLKIDLRAGYYERVYTSSGLSHLVYGNMLMDKDDKLWMAFYYNYSVYDTKNKISHNFEINYSREHLDYVTRMYHMPDNRIVSESHDAFIILNPFNLQLNRKMEPVVVSSLNSGNSSWSFYNLDKPVQLKNRQNSFSIDFSTLSFFKNGNMQFSYMLEGYDENWVDCGARQTAFYTNVNGGNYTFRVRAKAPGGEWQEGKPVTLQVASVFYATNWFKALLVISLLLCLRWYLMIIKKRSLKKEADKAISYFANSMHGKNKVEDLLWDITNNVITRTDLVDCVVYLLDEERKVLVQKAAFGEKSAGEYSINNPIEIPVGKGIVGSVAATGKPEMIKDTSADSRYISDDKSRLSELAVPIMNEGKVIGVIDSEHPDKNFFTQEHLHLLQTIASISGTKIINAQKEMEIQENEKRVEELKHQVTRAREQALQAQMNPHFIFNCLNSINGFILKNDPETASRFLIKFSKLIRLILEHSNEKAVSLQSELDALRLYIDMESLRFEKKFYFEINISDEILPDMIMIPPLIFQPFVENAIWHGLLHKDEAGRLDIEIKKLNENLECIIRDNGIGREASSKNKSPLKGNRKSLGLKLTRERISLLNEQENSGSSVQVCDLKDEYGNATGTSVKLIISLQNQLNFY